MVRNVSQLLSSKWKLALAKGRIPATNSQQRKKTGPQWDVLCHLDASIAVSDDV
jgi:hypothetical protein